MPKSKPIPKQSDITLDEIIEAITMFVKCLEQHPELIASLLTYIFKRDSPDMYNRIKNIFEEKGFFNTLETITVKYEHFDYKIIKVKSDESEHKHYIKKIVKTKEEIQAHHIVKLNKQLAEQATQLAEQETQLTEQETQLTEQATQLAEQATQLAKQEEQLKQYRIQVKYSTEEIQHIMTENKKLHSIRREQDIHIKAQTKRLEEQAQMPIMSIFRHDQLILATKVNTDLERRITLLLSEIVRLQKEVTRRHTMSQAEQGLYFNTQVL